MIDETPSTPQHFFNSTDGDLFEYADKRGFGDIHLKVDHATGLRAIIAIHNLKHGPALGGCRFIEYPSTIAALRDAMRLARGMSYKAALLDLPFGGGKSVLLKPKTPINREAYFEAFGRFVQECGGRYITAIDSGTTIQDMDVIHRQTNYVASLTSHGSPSPYTSIGVLAGIKAAVKTKLGKSDLDGVHVAIQGLGDVGYKLAEDLSQLGAQLTVTDINSNTVKRCVDSLNATGVAPEAIYSIDCDVFCPCALGAILNDDTIPKLRCSIVAGAANNQLQHRTDGVRLHDLGILYAPDYVVNAGGLIYATSKYNGLSDDEIVPMIQKIYDNLLMIFERSLDENRPTSKIADDIAMEKL